MSCNLGRVTCARCGTEVRAGGQSYRLPDDHGSMAGLLVVDAECPICQARYTAWLVERDPGSCRRAHTKEDIDRGFYELSFRSTFNDEPGPGDLPDVGKVEVLRVVRIAGKVVVEEPMPAEDRW